MKNSLHKAGSNAVKEKQLAQHWHTYCFCAALAAKVYLLYYMV